MVKLIIPPLRPLQGTLTVPPDKSITHRALFFNALAHGQAVIENVLIAEDTQATMRVLEQLVVNMTWLDQKTLQLVGSAGQFIAPTKPLYCGNSGTTARLLCGLLARTSVKATITGDSSLSRRPMARVLKPLQNMGILGKATNELPLTIQGSTSLIGIHYSLPVASAQIKTAILLAGLQAQGQTVIIQPQISRDHSERLLESMGAMLKVDALVVSLTGPQALLATPVKIPGDFSAGAFWLVAACLIPNSCLILANIGINPTRIALLDVLIQMGANIQIENHRYYGSEPVADIRVSASSLVGIVVSEAVIPNLQDEIPILLIAAACAQGVTSIRGASELRVKESDRIQAMHQGLQRCGIQTEIYPDGITVYGGTFQAANIDSFGDHRIAMAFLMAGACSGKTIKVKDSDCINTSYPDFIESMQKFLV